DGQQFTVFVKMNSQIGGFPVDSAVAISGTITANGINNVIVAFLMIDDRGDPQDVYIVENNQGRVFTDGDGFSPRQ
ncbi:MAG: hypothetical protein AAF901_07510, partial [Bacteroidota bacterium]